jgi:chaperonin GroES
MSNIEGAQDPYAQPGSDEGQSVLQPTTPAGSDLIINEDGSVAVQMGADAGQQDVRDHYANLAETLDPTRLNKIATDLLDAIDIDKQARAKRDEQYEKGLQRTGLGDEAPGGASFPGASKVVHPMLTEAAIDFAARIMNEMMPPDGPCKAKTIGTPTNEKDELAERTARYMNLQLTTLMPNVAYEFEMGFTQCPIGGAFYTKMVYDESGVSVTAVNIDKVHRPWSDGAFYTQPRITHEMDVDKWQFDDNIRNGLWLDVVNTKASSDLPTPTAAERATNKITGKTDPSENVDQNRTVFEASVLMGLEDDEAPAEPYIVTVDEQTRKVLAIYRNWKRDDPKKERLDFLIEWPFWPWRGGYPIGMTHMIGGLSGAATGSLRALLDSALLNNMPTGVHLKGGASVGGQNVSARPMQTTELQGSLVQDDVRKAYMPLPFPPPSPVLFQLLGFLVDAGKGVIRTTFDEYDKMTGNTPVGTANMFIEQGLKNFGAVHGRMHRSMARFLRQLWDINAETIDNVEVQDDFGELIVSREDFMGPMRVLPVSDPRVFSDIQRQSAAQIVSQRAVTMPTIYDLRKSEVYFLKQMKVPQPEQFMLPEPPQATQQNAVAENTTAARGLPVKAFPGQDHEAHLAVHCAFMISPLFGSNIIIAQKYLPLMIDHIAEHLALWYADAMLDATNTALRAKTGIPDLTIESMAGPMYEAPLDRLMAELTPEVMEYADERLSRIPSVIAQAQMLMQRFAPQGPMDPSIVAMRDVQRQEKADENTSQLKLIETQQKGEAQQQKAEADERKDALTAHKQQLDAEAKADERALREREIEAQREAAALGADTAAQAEQSRLEGIAATNDSRETVAEMNADAKLEANREDNQTALKIADKNAKAKTGTRLKTGTGMMN